MQLSRRQTLTVLAVTAATAALPASAAKAVTTPEILDIWPFLGDAGGAMVSIRCAVPLASVTARLSDGSGAEVARYELAPAPGSNPMWGTWTTPRLDGIPLGNYWLDCEAISQDGGVATERGELLVWLLPTYTATVTPTTITQARRTVMVEGTVVYKHPITQAIGPIAGMPVGITSLYWPQGLPNAPHAIVTCAADGSFTGRLTLDGAALVSAGSGGEPREIFVRHASTDRIEVRVQRYPVRIGVDIGATALNLGQSTTVEGSLEEFVDGRWRPLTAATVHVGFSAAPDRLLPTEWQQVTSDDHGRFRLPVTPRIWGAYYAMFDADVFHDGAVASTETVFVRRPVSFDQDRLLVRRTTGELWEISGIVYTPDSGQVVVVQFRPDMTSPWEELTRVTVGFVSAPNDGHAFKATFKPGVLGQVRAYAPQTNHTQAAASKAVAIRSDPVMVQPRHVPGGQPSQPPAILTPDRPAHR